ncbi:MAG TPA: YceI family protein [Verrucomicrobiae bacterium]|nr:YceI family protein [Verrucomicrobiae bacterium]
MKPSIIHSLAASAVLLAVAGCSDPADKVHKSGTSDPQKTASSASQSGKEYVIRAESTIGFVGSKVTGSHNGGFKNFAGTIRAANGRIVGTPEIKIGMQSTWSDNNRLTSHLTSADFFGVDQFPVSTFTVTSVEPSGAQQKVTGNLNLHGVSKSISFPANIRIADDAVTVKAEFAINRRDFNINYPGKPNDLIRDHVVIKLDLKATPGAARPEDQMVN